MGDTSPLLGARRPRLVASERAPLLADETGSAHGIWPPLMPVWPTQYPRVGSIRRGCWKLNALLTLSVPSILGSAIAAVSTTLVLISVAALSIATLPTFRTPSEAGLAPTLPVTFTVVETVCWGLFALELLLRLLTASSVPDERELRAWNAGVRARSFCWCPAVIRRVGAEFLQPRSVVDILAIAPPVAVALLLRQLPLSAAPSDSSLSALNILRLARVLKLGHRSPAMRLLVATLASSGEVIGFLLLYIAMLTVLLSAAAFYLEQGTYDANGPSGPGWYRPAATGSGVELTPFTSLPAAMWYLLETLTTVGYGDVIPVSPGGRVVGALAMVLSVLALGMPVAVLSNNFAAAYAEEARLALAARRAASEAAAVSAQSRAQRSGTASSVHRLLGIKRGSGPAMDPSPTGVVFGSGVSGDRVDAAALYRSSGATAHLGDTFSTSHQGPRSPAFEGAKAVEGNVRAPRDASRQSLRTGESVADDVREQRVPATADMLGVLCEALEAHVASLEQAREEGLQLLAAARRLGVPTTRAVRD